MWQTIAASETDANSPLNQTLLDKIRGNLDHLRGIGASMKFINARFTNNENGADFVLDSDQDWRDRYVHVTGAIFQGTNNDCDTVVLGGNKDGQIGSPYAAAPLSLRVVLVDQWMYTAAGGAIRTDNPRIWAEDINGDPDAFVWVDSSTGYLKVGAVTARPSGSKNLVCHLRLTWSDDQGAH